MVQPEGTLEHQIIPLQACIGGARSIIGLPLPIGEREVEPPSQDSYVDWVSGMRRSGLHRVQHPHVEVGWREILSWYPVEWVMEIVVDPSVVQQEVLGVGNTGTPDWHWDPGGTTCHFPGKLVDYVLEGTVGLAVECAHSLGEFQSISLANQFMDRLLGLSWYNTCMRGHRVINILW